jgi:NOL1/NOP2/sun family putative RNA methylase
MMADIPPQFLARMKRMLGNEYGRFLDSYDEPSSVGLRVNTLKLSPEAFQAISPYSLNSVPWSPAGYLLAPGSRPGKHPYHAAGLYYIQDPSAMAVGELMAAQPGEFVLDLAAAPGGKATHLAALMGGEGILVANDIHPRRVRDLCNNLERWGARNVVVTNETPSRLADHFGPTFDRVLVDAPCSGEGMFRKEPASCHEWTPNLVESCAHRQDAILEDAAKLVRPGGLMVYATCTFAPQENEGTVTRFLDQHPEFNLVEPVRFPGFATGRGDWLGGDVLKSGIEQTVRLWPHHAPGEGHFIAILQRDEGIPGMGAAREPWSHKGIPSEAEEYFQAFCEEHLTVDPALDSLALLGKYFYRIPHGLPDLKGLRVVHWGWWLGTLKVKRFEPSHALALGLLAGDARQCFDLSADDLRALSYLHGEVLPAPGPDGWVLITVDGFPLGWGKRVRGRIKSHSPKWLRWI